MFRLSSWLVLCAAVLLTVASCAKPERKVTLQIADYAELQKLITSHRGKVIVLDAWSTSCEPCLKEFPHLVALANHAPEKIACISLSMDYEGIGKPEDQRENVLAFLIQQHATMDNVLTQENSDAMLKHLGVGSIPAVFVYDRQGKLVKTFEHPGFTYADVEKLASELAAN
jgi:thiol-disulfide isomerase/thioredoxin